MDKVKKIYTVEFTETLSRLEQYEAESEEQAVEYARKQYENSEIVLDSNDLVGEVAIQAWEDKA